jgi:hypothetical protein
MDFPFSVPKTSSITKGCVCGYDFRDSQVLEKAPTYRKRKSFSYANEVCLLLQFHANEHQNINK